MMARLLAIITALSFTCTVVAAPVQDSGVAAADALGGGLRRRTDLQSAAVLGRGISVQEGSKGQEQLVTYARIIKSVRAFNVKRHATLNAWKSKLSMSAVQHQEVRKTRDSPGPNGNVVVLSQVQSSQDSHQLSGHVNDSMTIPHREAENKPPHVMSGPTRDGRAPPAANGSSSLSGIPDHTCEPSDCNSPRSDVTTGCFCDKNCTLYGDCCSGYKSVCLGLGAPPSPSPMPPPEPCEFMIIGAIFTMMTDDYCMDLILSLTESGEDVAIDHVCHNPCWETLIETFDGLYQHGCSELDPQEEIVPICAQTDCQSSRAETCVDNWVKDGCPLVPENDFMERCESYGECAERAFMAGLCPAQAMEQRHEAEFLAHEGEGMCEGHGYGPEECHVIGGGCCEFDDGSCWWNGNKCEEHPATKPSYNNKTIPPPSPSVEDDDHVIEVVEPDFAAVQDLTNASLSSCSSGVLGNCSGKPKTDCSHLNDCWGGNGQCYDSKCVCTKGFGNFDPNGPQDCRDYTHAACPDRCMGRGTCQHDPTSGEMVCKCFDGFTGYNCDEWTRCSALDFCSGHGKCTRSESEYGNVEACVCEPGYWGRKCENVQTECFGNCSGHGRCVVMASGYGRECECDEGFGNVDCSRYLYMAVHEAPRADTGVDTSSSASATETTTISTSSSASATETTTISSFRGACPGHCSGLGSCHANNESFGCICEPGFTGEDCGEAVPPEPRIRHGFLALDGRTVCVGPFTGPSCDIYNASLDRECRVLDFCSGRGVCAGGVGEKSCTCFEGFDGKKCDMFDVTTECPNHCSSNGRCALVPSIRCICRGPWTGEACDEPLCPVSDFAMCSGHGLCEQSPASHQHGCRCDPGWKNGPLNACELPVCANDCHQNGECLADHTCLCFNGWGGEDCSIRPEDNPVAKQSAAARQAHRDAIAAREMAQGGSQNGTDDESSDLQGVSIYFYELNGGCTGKDPVGIKYIPEKTCVEWGAMGFKGTCDRRFYGDALGMIESFENSTCTGSATYNSHVHAVSAGECISDYLDVYDIKFVCGDMTVGLAEDETPIDAVSCLNGCSQQGKCVDGVCECTDGFGGPDCSLPPVDIDDDNDASDGLSDLGELLELDEGTNTAVASPPLGSMSALWN